MNNTPKTQANKPATLADTLTLVAANGVPFTAQILRTGDKYGRDKCLTLNEDNPLGLMVEFYDARYPFELDKTERVTLGQFVSRYYVNTLLTGPSVGHGLDLQGDVPSWKIDARTLDIFLAWISNRVDQPV